jgi:cell division control protein 6
VSSRIGSSEVYCPAYSKKELVEILKDRAATAFSQGVDPALIEYCAKLSSREHGDARRAIDLLRRAGELASIPRNYGEGTEQQQVPLAPVIIIKNEDVDTAFEELQKDRVINIINSLPFQLKLVVAAIARLSYLTDEHWHSTSTLLVQYEEIHEKVFRDGVVKLVSRRRFAELLTELKNMGLIVSHTNSDGRHGYHAKYMLTEDPELIGTSTWQKEAWNEVVKVKERREEFLCAKLFRKVRRDFEKKEYHEPGDALVYEMNDWNWNLHVYGKTIPKLK